MPQTPQAPTSTDYRYMGDHATEMPVGDTLPWLAPGDFITLSGTDATSEKAKRLIDEGRLVEVSKIGEAGKEDQPTVNPEATDGESKGGK